KAHPYKNLLPRRFTPYGGGLLPPWLAPTAYLSLCRHCGWTKAHPYKNLLRRLFVPYGGGLLPPWLAPTESLGYRHHSG
ncbi:MAG: hypothetical protein PHS86_12420, partial [Syntrophaceae bacterium]|nr:hypothetical protein [Syntrophaceae bacterium]